MSRAVFAARFGNPHGGGVLCGYTREAETRAVLTPLAQARPRRGLEVGTALRLADHFGKVHKVFFNHGRHDAVRPRAADAAGVRLHRRRAREPAPCVRVRESLEWRGFAEAAVHVEGTEMAFLHPAPGTSTLGGSLALPI
jgi:hypothetical protein